MSGGVAAASSTASAWVDTATATYVSAVSFTVAGDSTGVIPIGAKYRYKQGGSYEYGSVITTSYSDPNTTITLATNDDYAMANAAITDSAWSSENCPVGHPLWYGWTPTLTGFSANPTSTMYRFMVEGRLCTVAVNQLETTGTSNAGTFTITGPITARTVTNGRWGSKPWYGANNGVYTANLSAYISTGSATINLIIPGSSWTASGTKNISFVMTYEI